jgi:hypothetical protein
MIKRYSPNEESREAARAAAAFVEQAMLLIAKERRFDRALDSLLDALRELEDERIECDPMEH